MLFKKPRGGFLKTYRPAIIFPIFLVIIILYYWSFTRKAKNLNQKFGKKKKDTARHFTRPGVFYPEDEYTVNLSRNVPREKLTRLLTRLEKKADPSLKKIPQRPVAMLLPFGPLEEKGRLGFSLLKKIRQFQYDGMLFIAAAHQQGGTFADLSYFSGKALRYDLGRVEVDTSFRRKELQATELYSYRPSFFFRERAWRAILPIIERVRLKTKIGFVLAGTIRNKTAYRRYVFRCITNNILLAFILNQPKKAGIKNGPDAAVFQQTDRILREKCRFVSSGQNSGHRSGFYIVK